MVGVGVVVVVWVGVGVVVVVGVGVGVGNCIVRFIINTRGTGIPDGMLKVQ